MGENTIGDINFNNNIIKQYESIYFLGKNKRGHDLLRGKKAEMELKLFL